MWGLDFDRRGQLFASTNVGGFVMLHGVQGGYYWKAFGKHGPLHNPYTFGYFDHVRHDGVSGGHVAVGGLFYEADALPAAWRGRYIAADLLDHSIHAHEVARLGSTFKARQVGDVLRANDTWFAPSDLTLGPDGALYVADWHDRRTAHPDPDADWDRTNGRIFAITARGAMPVPPRDRDLAARTDEQLVALLHHPNTWYRRKARRLLADRRAAGASDGLRRTALERRGAAALEALWAWYGCAGLDEDTFARMLRHPDADVRAWSVRLVGDEPTAPARLAARLVEMAGTEPDVAVRAQLACTARRLAARHRAGPGSSPAGARPGRQRPAPATPPLVGRGAACDRRQGTRHRPVHGARRLAIGDDPVDDPGPARAPVRPGTHRRRRRGLRSTARVGAVGGCAASAAGRAGRGDARAGDRRGRAGPGAGRHRPGRSRSARRDPDPPGRPVRQPAGGRASPGGRRATADHPTRTAWRCSTSWASSRTERLSACSSTWRSRDDSASFSVRSAALAALGRFEDAVDRRGPAGRLLASRRRLAVAGAGAAPEPGLVGAGLPGGDRPRRAAGQGGDARPARALCRRSRRRTSPRWSASTGA